MAFLNHFKWNVSGQLIGRSTRKGKTYDKKLFAVEFDSEDAHDSDEESKKGASISWCPEKK